MNFNQTFSILFWLNKSKANSKGLVPIWVEIPRKVTTSFRGKVTTES
jgi:hypothetical protein